ncbi:UDP-glucose 4-epimerase GalE [Nanoarchaeota archaeon]
MQDTAIVYMVAGLSSRFGGRIKQFARVGPENESLIEYSLKQALPAGFTKIVFIVGEKTEKPFKEKFGNNYNGIPVEYAFQGYNKEKRDRPWGTCDAVCSAIDLINEPFVIATGDDLYGEKGFEILANHLKNKEGDATLGMKLIEMLPEEGSVNRGIFYIDKENNMIDGEESIGINRENFIQRGFNENSPVNMGIFGLHPKTLELLNERLKEFKEQNVDDRKIECYLNVELAKLIQQEKIKMKLYYSNEKWLGITNPGDEIKVREELKKQVPMNILVTGGAGYIGSITSRQLHEKGYNVIVYDSLIKGHRDAVTTTFVKGCLSDKKLLDETFKKFNIDAVIHFAGFMEVGESMKNPSKFFQNNIYNGITLLDVMVANNVKKIIFSSSAAVYAPRDSLLKEDDLKEPASVYGETKLMFERILKWYDKIYGLKSISLRYFNASGTDGNLGERHDPETHIIPLTIFAALGKRQDIKIFGTDYNTPDGTCMRDYVHVKDLAEAHILALQNLRENSKIYNVGTGEGLSVRQIINAVKQASGTDFKIIETERRPGDPAILVADSFKIQKELGWKPKHNFEEGLNETVEWFKNNFSTP